MSRMASLTCAPVRCFGIMAVSTKYYSHVPPQAIARRPISPPCSAVSSISILNFGRPQDVAVRRRSKTGWSGNGSGTATVSCFRLTTCRASNGGRTGQRRIGWHAAATSRSARIPAWTRPGVRSGQRRGVLAAEPGCLPPAIGHPRRAPSAPGVPCAFTGLPGRSRSCTPPVGPAGLAWESRDPVTAPDPANPDLVIRLDGHGAELEELVSLVIHQLPDFKRRRIDLGHASGRRLRKDRRLHTASGDRRR